ncbi:nitroreductase family deazaflavin-dependent oxidoreductase, partial [Streptomyces sp. SID7499]|nr:nitroreductase family deazaflavin-dependent oxidoreductase [Streptomyces sp. SID7499]
MTSQQHARRSRPPLPRGWRRRLARLPIAFYRVGLGPVFGRRLLLLHHTGRNS